MIFISKINNSGSAGLTKEKKELMRQLMGSASSPEIDYNKLAEELKDDESNQYLFEPKSQ